MKIAVSGKGGVGKTTVAATIAKTYADKGYSVLAVDADPDANLASALGFPDPQRIVPLIEMGSLIEERMGAKPGATGSLFKLNPKVDDLPEKLWVDHQGIKLMKMGTIKRGGSGCACPESVLLKNLVQHLVLQRKEVVILDMEAGVEHLGRATAHAVGRMLIVVEPGRHSVGTAKKIRELARDIGLNRLSIIVNKVKGERDREFAASELNDFDILGFIPYDARIAESDMLGEPAFTLSDALSSEIKKVVEKLEEAEREN
jgi:CO dehydrogenase maturation factor